MAIPAPNDPRLAALLARLLDTPYTQIAQPVVAAIQASLRSGLVAERRAELIAEAERLADAGQPLSRDNAFVAALLVAVAAAQRRNAARVDAVAEEIERAGARAGQESTRALALPGLTRDVLRQLGLNWIDPGLDDLVTAVNLAGNPAFETALREFESRIIASLIETALRGQRQSWGPRRTARHMGQLLDTFPAAEAANLLRTLQLASFRRSTAAAQNANRQRIARVVRVAVLDATTCLACVSLHGTVIWDRQTDSGPIPAVDDHHRGRCTSVAIVEGRETRITSGREWWDSLDSERQRAIAGAANHNAMQAGAAQLSDFVTHYDDELFGRLPRQASLRDLIGDSARQYYERSGA